MQGLNKLEAEIKSAKTRLMKLRNAGRIRTTDESSLRMTVLDNELSEALTQVVALKGFEVGREQM